MASRSPVTRLRQGFWARLVARTAVLAILSTLVPTSAHAAFPSAGGGESPLPPLEPHLPDDAPAVLFCVVAALSHDDETRWFLATTAGTISDGYTYSAFGELLAHTGDDPQPYAFTGEPLDPNSGWQYHRARWMDPSVGRFPSVDRFEGASSTPSTLHRYIYAADRPVDATDPTGLVTLPGVFTGMSGFTNAIFGTGVPLLGGGKNTARVRLIDLTQIPLVFGAFRTGMGAVAEMRVEPSGAKSRLVEELSLVEDTCRINIAPCVVDSRTNRTTEEFPVGKGLYDPRMLGDRPFPAKKDTFYDPHLLVSNENVLAMKRKSYCETTCRQVYRCPETQEIVGTFRIRYKLRPGQLEAPGMGVSLPMTFVQVQKARELTEP